MGNGFYRHCGSAICIAIVTVCRLTNHLNEIYIRIFWCIEQIKIMKVWTFKLKESRDISVLIFIYVFMYFVSAYRRISLSFCLVFHRLRRRVSNYWAMPTTF